MNDSKSVVSAATVIEENESDVQYPSTMPPWPEWNEEELSSTNWDEFDDFRYRELPIILGTDREISESIGPEKINWRRVNEIFPDDIYQVVEVNQPHFVQQDTVFASNRHLMGTEIFRMLLYCLKNISFISTFKQTQDLDWEPWKHVHRPEYNPNGKYFIKLFFLGKWRKLVVDDYLPYAIDSGSLLIPFISTKQLWLPLLCKAILVVASLSKFDWRRISISNLLTGCFSHLCNQSSASETDLWEIIDANVTHIKDTNNEEVEDETIEKTPEPESSSDEMSDLERYVLAVVESTAVPGLNTSIPVKIQVVLNQCHLRKYAKHWKDIRYNQWAYEKGILKEKLPSSNSIGQIQIFCPVRKMHPHQLQSESQASIGDETKEEKNQGNLEVAREVVTDPVEGTLLVHDELPASDEICTWLEFPQIHPYLVVLETLYVTSSFKHQILLTSIEDINAVSTCAEGGENETEDAGNLVFHDLVPQPSFYVYLDDLQSTTLYFVVEKCFEFIVRSSHLVLKNANDTSLVIEPFCWRDLRLDFSDKRTVICSQTVKLTVPPGVNVFKLWYSAGEHFFVGIFSTAEFKTVPRCKLNLLLSQHSVHLSGLVKEIVSKFNTLLNSLPGTPEHGQAYSEFIEAFCPGEYFEETTHINKKVQIKMEVLRKCEDFLMEKILNYDNVPSLSSLDFSPMSSRSLGPPLNKSTVYLIVQCQEVFQDPVFGESYLKRNAPHYYRQFVSSSQILGSSQLIEKKRKRSNMSKTNKSNLSLQQRKRTRENLLKMKEAAANASKISMINSALEDIMDTNAVELYTLLAATPGVTRADVILSDLRHAVNLIEISGSVDELKTNSWCLIARLNLNLHSTTECLVGFYFSLVNAEDYRLHYELVRNQVPCSEPLKSVKMSNHIYSLRQEEFGYTLLVYGYPPVENISVSGSKQSIPWIKWKLQLVSASGTENILHICQLYPPLDFSIFNHEEEESTVRPRPMCDFGYSQSAPDRKIIQCSNHIEADTKFERLKFRLTTWSGNIVTLRFSLESSCYNITLRIVRRGSEGEEEYAEQIGGISRSCVSFERGENSLDDQDSQDTVILTEQSDDGEVILPAIVTTADTCSRRNGDLILEGTIQIAYKSQAQTLDQRIIDAKRFLIKKYLTREESSHEIGSSTPTDPQPEPPCESTRVAIPYSLTAAHTYDEARAVTKELSLQVESDLLDTSDPEVIEAIQRGKEKRDQFLCKVFKEAPCLGHIKRKVPRFQVFLTDLFGQEDTEKHELNRTDSSFVGTQVLGSNEPFNDHNRAEKPPSGISEDESGNALFNKGFKNKWQAFYDQMNEALRPRPSCYDKTRTRLYRERDRYIQFRNYEREKYAPNPQESMTDLYGLAEKITPDDAKPKGRSKGVSKAGKI